MLLASAHCMGSGFKYFLKVSVCGRGMSVEMKLIDMGSKYHLVRAAFWEYSGEQDKFYFRDRVLFPTLQPPPPPPSPTPK